jgi:hypothetical protein
MDEIQLSSFQKRVLWIPEDIDVFLGGGRGGAKSFCFSFLALRHIEQYGQNARILYIRQTYKGLADFEQITRNIFGAVYGNEARYNSTEHVWKFPNGAYMELGQLEGPADYSKYQGRSFTLLLIDEAGQYPSPELLDRLRSNLRGPKDMPIREVKAANPGDVGHHWIASRYVFKGAAPWEPFHEEKSGRTWVYAPSTYRDNPFIDHKEYKAQLTASCPYDPELLRAWLDGDWTVLRGAFFGPVLSESRNAADPWDYIPRGWDFFLAHDYGSSAPSVTYVVAESPGEKGPDGRFYPKDSLILVDELSTSIPGQPSQGLGWTIPILSDAIKEMCKRWKVPPAGVADDAIFSIHGHAGGSIADEFRRFGVYFHPAQKGSRVAGWEIMRRLLADAGKPDRPGLYVSRNCSYFWETVPSLGRDPRRVEDVDTRQPDHGADACRYAVMRRKPITTFRVVWP